MCPHAIASSRKRFEAAIELYLRHCFKTRTVARASELAVFLDADRSHLGALVHRAYGRQLRLGLRERQLARAEALLRRSSLPVDEVGSAAGFGHRSTFYRVFREAFGESPASFRAKTRKLRLYE